jgi:formate dehydrogenase iron-sulfur subunit
VVYTELTADEPDKDAFSMACPYDIPRVDEKSGRVVKCDMCIDRVKVGLLPACVKTCPTGAMNFGDRDEMLALADKHLAAALKKYPEAELVDADSVRVIYLVQTDPDSYYESLSADASDTWRGPMSRKQFLASLGRPVKRMTS